MSGSTPPPTLGGGNGVFGGARTILIVLAALGIIGLIIGALWFMTRSPRTTAPRLSGPPGVVGEAWNPPPPPREEPPRIQPVVAAPPMPAVLRPSLPTPRRARASAMSVYDDPRPPQRPERPAPAGPAPEPDKIAGLPVMRAELLRDPEWWLMPGDKIPCENLEPITARTGAPFSATVPFDVRSRTGTKTVVPRGSRVVGRVVKGLENGEERLAAIITHVEGPSVPGRPTVVVPLNSPAADVMGQVDLEGNIDTHFWSRLGAVAAYAGLDLVSTAGGAIAGTAIGNAVSGATGGRGGVGFYNMQSYGRTLAGREFNHQIQRPPSFSRPQGQSCSVFVNHPIDFRAMKALAP